VAGDCVVEVRRIAYVADGKRILDIENLRFEDGLNGVLGPNGAGKTTMLKILARLLRASIEDFTVCPPSLSAYMPAHPQVDVLATVEDVIKAGMYGAASPSLDSALEVLDRFGLAGIVQRRFSTLSSGEQKIVCLARALARQPRLLLLDEPLSFLDVRNQVLTLDILEEYSRSTGATVIVTTHNLEYIWRLDTLTLLSQGRIAYHGNAENVEESALSRVYGIPITRVEVEGLGPVFLPGASAR